MKKILSIIISALMLLMLVACGSSGTETSGDGNAVATENTTESEVSENANWKQFLTEYEEWVDKYIEITKKYKENPSDLSILSDYSTMMTELAEWSTKTEEMQKELGKASPAELAEYSSELARIAAKIAQVVS